MLVNPYEKVPVDGIVLFGATSLNTSALTGESIPRYVEINDKVLSGFINSDKPIKIKATKLYKDSTANKILNLIENSFWKKSKSENYIRSFAKIYTPIVCILALFTFIVPTLYQLLLKVDVNFSNWAYRAISVLVISCPCAILISIPIAFFSGIGLASKNGILIKGSNYIEALSKVKNFMFDKTGTMTKGVFKVVGLHHCKISEEELFRLVAHVEYFSNHPIAKSIVSHYGKDVDVNIVKDLKEIGGRGLSGIVDGKKLLIGNDKLMDENNIEYIDCRDVGTVVHVAINNSYEGHIFIDDVIKENAKNSIQLLKKYGAKKIIMLTGDRENISKNVASNIGIDEYHSNLLPDGKLKYVENEMQKYRVSFVGDGINDVPCITKSDVGIVMGEKGADVAIDLADVVIMDDDIMSLPKTLIKSFDEMLFAGLIDYIEVYKDKKVDIFKDGKKIEI